MRPPGIDDRLAKIRLLAIDVDGVLTDGRLYYDEHGEHIKSFHVRDGLGLRLLRESGITIAVITARTSPALARRLEDLRLRYLFPGREDKAAALHEVMVSLGVPAAEVAYVADDVLDLPALRMAGVSIAVADAHPRVKAEVAWITEAAGGCGAVREISDALLEARGGLDAAIESMLKNVSSEPGGS